MSEEQQTQTTEDIAAEVIEDAAQDAADATTEAAPESGEATPEATPETPTETAEPPPTEEEVSEAVRLIRKHGFRDARRPDGREFRIAHSKVEKMIQDVLNARDEAIKPVQTLTSERDQYKQVADRLTPILEKLDEGPEAFLAFVAAQDPRYQAFVAKGETPPAPSPVPDEMPEGSITLKDGSKTYSLEDVQKKVVPWIAAQVRKDMEGDLKPIRETLQQQREREEREEREAALLDRAKATIERAQTWPGFGKLGPNGEPTTDDQKEVLRVFRENPTFQLWDAYQKVFGPRLTTREALLEEMQKSPRSTSVPASTERPTTSTPKTTEEIAAQVVAEYAKASKG